MPLEIMQLDFNPGAGRTPTGAVHSRYAAPFLGLLATVYPDDVAVHFQAGNRQIRSAAPVIEGDSAAPVRRWTAQSDLITFERASDVLDGMGRVKSASTTGTNGLYASLAAPLTSYSIGCVAKITTGSQNNCIFNAGATGTDRVMLYTSTADKPAIQHGSGDIELAADSVTVDGWFALLASYDHTTNAIRMYRGDATPIIDSTFTADPPASVLASILATREGLVEMAGEVPLLTVWTRALHLDSAALDNALVALNGIAGL